MSTKKSSTKIKPLQDRVLLKRVSIEPEIQGGIVLPDSAKKKPDSAEVIAVGPGKTSKDGTVIPLPLESGDIVLINKYCGQEVTIDGDDLLIVNMSDIIAVIEK